MFDPKTFNPDTLDFDAERLKKVRSMKDPLLAMREFTEKLKATRFSEEEKSTIRRAVRLLETANLINKNKNYLAHPLRVASFILAYEPSVGVSVVILAVLHNIFEVTDLSPAAIQKDFGDWICENCLLFRVDRTKQKSDQAYLKDFYSQFCSDRRLLLIKLFDKFDNVLSVYFNPDQEIRRRYLDEIEQWLIPRITDQDIGMREVFCRLIAETRKTPPVDKDIFLAQHSSKADLKAK